MKLLLIILSVMTFTVKDRSTVTAGGVLPADMQVTYACSYQRGQVRAGDEATLSLSGLGGITVQKIEMALRANASSGAGTVLVMADDMQLALKTYTYRTVSDAVQVYKGACTDVHTLVVRLIGGENSLYVDSYTITYTPVPVCSVTLMNGNEVYDVLTEENGGQGIILPSVPSAPDWHFVGWSETPFERQTDVPVVKAAYETYAPKEDCTLWAVFQQRPASERVYVFDLQSGDYLYVNRHTDKALAGVPSNGKMVSEEIDETSANQVFHVELGTTADTAYITHVQTGTPIGYSGLSLVAKKSPWLVYHDGEETIFYILVNNNPYVLWLNISPTQERVTGLLSTNSVSPSPMSLVYPREEMPIEYTCYPPVPEGIMPVYIPRQTDYILPIGPYELYIHNGQKILKLQ